MSSSDKAEDGVVEVGQEDPEKSTPVIEFPDETEAMTSLAGLTEVSGANLDIAGARPTETTTNINAPVEVHGGDSYINATVQKGQHFHAENINMTKNVIQQNIQQNVLQLDQDAFMKKLKDEMKKENTEEAKDYDEDDSEKVTEETSKILKAYRNLAKTMEPGEVLVESLSAPFAGTHSNKPESIYIPRQFKRVEKEADQKEEKNEKILRNLDEMVSDKKPCLILANAGLGKTFLWSHSVRDWANSRVLADLHLLVNVSARSFLNNVKMPMKTMMFHFTTLDAYHKQIPFAELAKLARMQKLGYCCDGLDELSNLSTAELQKIKMNVAESIDNPEFKISGTDFIIGLITGMIHPGSLIIGMGRPRTILAVASKLLSGNCNLYELLEFSKENVRALVHKLVCGETPACIQQPEDKCKQIIATIEENPKTEDISHTPSICSSMVKFFNTKLNKGEDIDVGNVSVVTIQLNVLMMNITHQHHSHQDEVAFTDWTEEDIGRGIMDVCRLCFESLADGVIQINGERVKDKFHSKYLDLSVEAIEKTAFFRVVTNKSGSMMVEGTHLSNHELLAAAIYCIETKKEANSKLGRMNMERQVAVLVNVAHLISGQDPITNNFRRFLEKMSGKKIDEDKIVAQIYKYVMELSESILPEIEDERKKLKFRVMSAGKKVLMKTFSRRQLRTSQVQLLAKLVTITRVPSHVKIEEKPGTWVLELPQKGEEASNLLQFVTLEGVPPAKIKAPKYIADGLTTVVHGYITEHTHVTAIFPDDCWFILTRALDFPSLVSLCSRNVITTDKIGAVYCRERCGAEDEEAAAQLLLNIKEVEIFTNQSDNMWKLLAAGAARGCKIEKLQLGNFTVSDETVEWMSTFLLHIGVVLLVRLSGTPAHWNILAKCLQENNQKTIQKLWLSGMEINGKKEMTEAMLSVEEVVLNSEFTETEADWQDVVGAMEKRSKEGTLGLKKLTVYRGLQPSDGIKEKANAFNVEIK